MGVAVCCERFHSSSLTNEVVLLRKMSPSLETLLPYLVISRERGHRLEVRGSPGLGVALRDPNRLWALCLLFLEGSVSPREYTEGYTAGSPSNGNLGAKISAKLREMESQDERQARGRGLFP